MTQASPHAVCSDACEGLRLRLSEVAEPAHLGGVLASNNDDVRATRKARVEREGTRVAGRHRPVQKRSNVTAQHIEHDDAYRLRRGNSNREPCLTGRWVRVRTDDAEQ